MGASFLKQNKIEQASLRYSLVCADCFFVCQARELASNNKSPLIAGVSAGVSLLVRVSDSTEDTQYFVAFLSI